MLSLFRLMRAGAELGRVDLETRVVVAVGAERALETRDFPRMFFKETILIYADIFFRPNDLAYLLRTHVASCL